MSLKLWIPGTDGTLKNQGLLQLPSPSYNAISEVTSGKLGKAIQGLVCYHLSSDLCPSLWSVACWSKFTSGYSTSNNLILCLNTADSEDSKFYLSIINNTTLNIGRGSSSTVSYNLSGNFQVNTWYHLAATFDGTTTKLYLNGSLVNSSTGGSTKSALNLTIGGRSTNANGTDTTGKGWATNDVRIYDHCLTPQEVKEISKGLVCHYTLGSESLTTSSNLITGLSGGTQCTISGSTVNISGTNSDTYFYIKTAAALTEGKLYRLSCYGSGFPSGAYYNFPVGASSNTSQGYIKVLNGYCELVFTCNSTIVNAGTNILMDDNRKSAGAGTISNIDLREYTGVADSSGYCNNGTISGNPSLDSNTPRYNKAILFPANSSSTITTPLSIDNSAWTIAFWEKCDWTNVETSSPYIVYWGNCIRIRKYSTTARMRALFYYKDSEGTQTNALPYFMDAAGTDTSWKHFVVVFDGSAIKVYLNGTYIRQITLSSGFSLYTITGNLVLNYTAETIAKSLSDFRVYTTALSADDVAELYNLGAQIS